MSQTDVEARVAQEIEAGESKYFGKYRGKVDEVDYKTGYLTAFVPKVYGENLPSPKAAPCVPYAGKKYGMAFLPKKDDGVWIEFEAGNKEDPIWSGFWWADNEMADDTKKEDVRGIVTKEKLKFIMDDANKTIILEHPSGSKIELGDKKIILEVKKQKIEISSSSITLNDGAFEVK